MESMESSYADEENGGLLQENLIPNLTNLASGNVNFSSTEKLGGGIDLAGTGWTVAALLSKLGGLPFNLVGDENLNRNVFLPGAIILTDILNFNGYKQLFIFGSDKHFAGRDSLLENHGNVEIHDINWYKRKSMLPQNYSVFWGFEDKKLFEFAKYELMTLQESSPFMLGLLTVDTHMPTGYQCDLCPAENDMPIKRSIRCADFQISNFIQWCKEQVWYKDTVIIILGDHLFMATEKTNPFSDDSFIAFHRLKSDLCTMYENPRRWLNIFINSIPQKENFSEKQRKFSSFDIFPSILASIGCDIQNDRLGFGTNLFSTKKTLLERYSEEYINTQIMKRNSQYENLTK